MRIWCDICRIVNKYVEFWLPKRAGLKGSSRDSGYGKALLICCHIYALNTFNFIIPQFGVVNSICLLNTYVGDLLWHSHPWNCFTNLSTCAQTIWLRVCTL